MPTISVRDEQGKSRNWPLKRLPVTVGRSPGCDIHLDHQSISRRHAQIIQEKGKYVLRDLKSRNKTILNNEQIDASVLNNGDEIRIGPFVLVFEEDAAVEAASTNNVEVAITGVTFPNIYDLEDSASLSRVGSILSPPPGRLFEPGLLRQTAPDKVYEILESIYDVSAALNSIFSLPELMDQILKAVFRIVRADRGALLLLDGASGTLSPAVARKRSESSADGLGQVIPSSEVRLSKTIVSHVIENGESVLFLDTSMENALKNAHSVAINDIRSAMCVPIRDKARIVGAIYVDTAGRIGDFSDTDLRLMTAIGNTAGMAIANAHMHAELLEQERLRQQLEVAATVQESFLPKIVPGEVFCGFELAVKTIPAKNVGGDFYDVLVLPNQRLGIAIGDVSGKGVPAALAMARLISDFRQQISLFQSPAATLTAVNRILAERRHRGMFVTAYFAVLDAARGTMVHANAGHLPLVVRKKSGDVVTLGDPAGPPLGVLSDTCYQDAEFLLKPEDVILFYTDGLTEAKGSPREGEEDTSSRYGLDPLMQLLHTEPRSCQDLVADIIGSVVQFRGTTPPNDDLALIVAKLRDIGP